MPWFKRAYRGLYGNRMIRFGNKISFADNKSRRTWKPNVQSATLWSETLQEQFKCRVTTYVMRCIRKKGGFDQYLLKTKDSEIKYPRALELKERIRVVQHRRRLEQKEVKKTDDQSGSSKTQANETQNLADVTRIETESPHSTGPLHQSPKLLSFTSRGLLDIL